MGPNKCFIERNFRVKGDNNMKRYLYFLIIAFLLSSCASHNATYQSNLAYDIDAQKNKVTENGIELMAKPVLLKSEYKSYFGENLIKYGVLPVQVYISNHSEEDFLLSTDGIILIDPSQKHYPVVPVNDVVKKVKKSYWRTAGWGVAFGLIGAVPSMINVNHTNKKIQEDYASKVLKSGNVPDGAVTEGTVFFEVPKDIISLDGWEFKLPYKTPNDNGLSTIGCCLVGQIEKRKSNTASENNSDTN
jgi:hypothetical protein